jgi:hypothetical protein
MAVSNHRFPFFRRKNHWPFPSVGRPFHPYVHEFPGLNNNREKEVVSVEIIRTERELLGAQIVAEVQVVGSSNLSWRTNKFNGILDMSGSHFYLGKHPVSMGIDFVGNYYVLSELTCPCPAPYVA